MTRVCKLWDSCIRHDLTTLKTGARTVLTERSELMALCCFLARTSSITCLDIEVAGPVVFEVPSIVRLASLSQLVQVTLDTGIHSVNAFGDLVEGLSALQKLQTLRLFTYRMTGSPHTRLVIPRDRIRCLNLDLKILGGPSDDEHSSEFRCPFDFHVYFVGVTSATVVVPFRLLSIRCETLVDLEIGPGVEYASGNIHLTTPRLETLVLSRTTTPRTLRLFADCSLQLLECHSRVQIHFEQPGGRLEVANLALHAFYARRSWQLYGLGHLSYEKLHAKHILLRGTAQSLGSLLTRSTSVNSVRFESDLLLRSVIEGEPKLLREGLLASCPSIVINTFGLSNIDYVKTVSERCPGSVTIVACGKASDQSGLCRSLADLLLDTSVERCCDDRTIQRWSGTRTWSY